MLTLAEAAFGTCETRVVSLQLPARCVVQRADPFTIMWKLTREACLAIQHHSQKAPAEMT